MGATQWQWPLAAGRLGCVGDSDGALGLRLSGRSPGASFCDTARRRGHSKRLGGPAGAKAHFPRRAPGRVPAGRRGPAGIGKKTPQPPRPAGGYLNRDRPRPITALADPKAVHTPPRSLAVSRCIPASPDQHRSLQAGRGRSLRRAHWHPGPRRGQGPAGGTRTQTPASSPAFSASTWHVGAAVEPH